MTLITAPDLSAWMGRQVDLDRATVAIEIAEGWLLDATRLDPWPDPTTGTVPPDLRAWCIELSALAYVNNPRQMIQRQAGGVITAWANDALSQRRTILADARARYNAVGMPRGSFPDAQSWPDPAIPRFAAWPWYT